MLICFMKLMPHSFLFWGFCFQVMIIASSPPGKLSLDFTLFFFLEFVNYEFLLIMKV